MCQTISTLLDILSFIKNSVGKTSITPFFFFNCWKVKYLNYKSIILIFSANLPVILIYYLYKRKYNPTTRRTSRIEFVEFQQWTLKLIWTLYLCLSTKSCHNKIILSYLIVFLGGSGFHNPNYLKMKKRSYFKEGQEYTPCTTHKWFGLNLRGIWR